MTESTLVDYSPNDVIGTGTTPRARLLAARFRRVAAVSATLVGTQAITSVLGFAFWTLAARQFSLYAVGLAGAAIALMMLLGTFGMLGLGTLLIAELPRTDPGHRRLKVRSALVLSAVTSTALGLIVAAGIALFPRSNLASLGSLPTVLAFAVGTGLTGLTLVLDQAVLVSGTGLVQLERNTVASVVKIGALLIFTASGQHSGMAIFTAWTVGNLMSLPVVAWRTRGGLSQQHSKRLFDLRSLRGLGRTAASHHALNLVLQAPLQLLSLVVIVVLTTQDNGYFSTDKLVSGFVFVLPFAVTIGLFATAGGDERQMLDRMRFTIPFGIAASLLADVVLLPLAPLVLDAFGHTYSVEGVTTLRILVLAGLPFVIKDHWIALCRIQGRTWAAAKWSAAGAGVEMAGAVLGAWLGGTTGLCAVWVGVLAVEAAVLTVPLRRAAQQARMTQQASSQAVPLAAAASGADPSAVVAGDALAELEIDTFKPSAEKTAKPSPKPNPGPAAVAASPNRAGPVTLLMSTGLLLIAGCVASGRGGGSSGVTQLYYWLGLSLIFVPAALRIISSRTNPRERLIVSIAAPILLQLSREVLYPTRFMFHDELIHANALRSIVSSHHLFKANPLLPVTASYPGLESATDALHAVTGLSVHTSAVILLLVGRLAMTLALVAIVAKVTGSQRIACLAALVYVCNPQALFFNAQYSYQSLALPLAVVTAYLVMDYVSRRALDTAHWWGAIVPLLALTATVVTHHLTSMLLVAALVMWTLLEWLLHRRSGGSQQTRPLALISAIGVVIVVAWTLRPGNEVGGYLDSITSSAGSAIEQLLRGQQNKKLFTDSSGAGTPLWEQAFAFASVGLLVGGLIPALWRARSWVRRRRSLAILLFLLGLMYPVVPAGHLTSATAEVTDRAAGFLFLGVGFVLATWLGRRTWSGRGAALLGAATAVVFIGQIVLGSGPASDQVPGKYLVSADARSIDAPNLSAAQFLATAVKPGARVYSDRDSGLLAAADGHAYTVTHVATNIDVSRLLLAPTFTAADRALIKRADIQYVVVDERDSTSLPHLQVYIESGEYGSQNRRVAVSRAALTKLASVPGVQRIYDNGDLVIYDVSAFDGS